MDKQQQQKLIPLNQEKKQETKITNENIDPLDIKKITRKYHRHFYDNNFNNS